MPPPPAPYGYLVCPEQLDIKQLPPHPFFGILPEYLQPIGQSEINNQVQVKSYDGIHEQPAKNGTVRFLAF